MSASTPAAPSGDTSPEVLRGPRAVFVTTRWSVVLRAGRNDTPQARSAMDNLCQTYWYPLYASVRRRGYPPEDAQDLTQEFFARLLERNWVGHADEKKGRFRSFLLSAMGHFLSDEPSAKDQPTRGAKPRAGFYFTN